MRLLSNSHYLHSPSREGRPYLVEADVPPPRNSGYILEPSSYQRSSWSLSSSSLMGQSTATLVFGVRLDSRSYQSIVTRHTIGICSIQVYMDITNHESVCSGWSDPANWTRVLAVRPPRV